jgi:carbonic anhydrase
MVFVSATSNNLSRATVRHSRHSEKSRDDLERSRLIDVVERAATRAFLLSETLRELDDATRDRLRTGQHLGTDNPQKDGFDMTHPHVSPQQALLRLRAGNDRFISDTRSLQALASSSRRHELLEAQHPFATILTCSDSRVPVELVFDQGLGDLFVIRVAGNVVAPSLIGSVEYAAEVLGTQLVIVMGHSRCGAVKATIDVVRGTSAVPTENIGDIVERIRPGIASVLNDASAQDTADVLDSAIGANVRHSVRGLRTGSPLVQQRISEGRLVVLGATYDIGSGRVSFLDVPAELRQAPVVSGRADAALAP